MTWVLRIGLGLLAATVATGTSVRARAEGVGAEPKAGTKTGSAADHLYAAQTILPGAGGLVALGGPSLRRLPDGGRRWETLHTVPGDNSYRVAADDSGRLLAVWEGEPLIHLLSPTTKGHVSFPKPAKPSPEISRFQITSLLFSPSGRDALVYMTGTVQITTGSFRGPSPITTVYRVHLDDLADGKTATPALIFRVDHGYLLHAGPRGAVFAMPKTPGQRCDYQGCSVAQLVAYEISGDAAAAPRTLFTAPHGEIERVRVVRGSDEERVAIAMEVSTPRRSDVLQWRYGEAAAQTRPLPWSLRDDTVNWLLWTRIGDFVAFRRLDNRLEISRERAGAAEPIAMLGSLQSADLGLHGFGERSDGRLWLHWGDHVGFVAPSKPARSYSLASLMPRRSDWGGDILIRASDQLWVGIDGRGRDYVRVSMADAERRSQPWPANDITGVSGSGGEGDVTYKKDPSTADRLYSDFFRPVPGALISLGGPKLRRLTNGAAHWEVLHQVPGDSLYRIVADESGRLLAAWEKETVIHFFAPDGKHVTIPKPALMFSTSTGSTYNALHVEDLEFAANGRDALVFTTGQVGASATFMHAAHWIALDGKSEPRQAYRVDRAVEIHTSRRGAIFVLPQTQQQECSHMTCWPIAAIVAYEIAGDRVTQRTLLDSSRADMVTAVPVRGSNDQRVAMVLDLALRRGAQRLNGGRALLRWRWGDAAADFRPLTGNGSLTPIWLLTSSGDFIEAIHRYDAVDEHIEFHRYPPTGAEEITKLPALEHGTNPQSMGQRSDGRLWLQWGENLALLTPGKPARRFNIDRLMVRGWEWAGALIYVPTPESLWVGLDGRGRQYVRLDLADVDRRSQPWPDHPPPLKRR